MNAIAAVPRLIAELKRCYEREDMIIRALKGVWIGDTCWHQPSEHLEDIAETRGSKLGYIASLLQVDVNQISMNSNMVAAVKTATITPPSEVTRWSTK